MATEKKKRIEMVQPKKSMYKIEEFDSQWELEHANDLENNNEVKSWTRKHGYKIPYSYNGKKHEYNSDFFVELINGDIEFHEVKSSRDIDSPKEQEKFRAAKKWCEENTKFNRCTISFKIVTRE